MALETEFQSTTNHEKIFTNIAQQSVASIPYTAPVPSNDLGQWLGYIYRTIGYVLLVLKTKPILNIVKIRKPQKM
jgi:hypothetical protein